MTTYKNTNDDYHIVVNDGAGNLTIAAATAITGDLTVTGNVISGSVINQVLTGDGSTTVFALDRSTTAAAILVAVGGSLKTPGISQDYTVAGNVLTFNSAPTGTIDIRFL